MDKDLFQRVIPWQCLGSVWSRRGSGADIQARDHLLRSCYREGPTLDNVIWVLVDTHKSAIFGFGFNHIRV